MAFVGDGLETFASTSSGALALKCGADTWTWRSLMNGIGMVEDFLCRATARGARIALTLEDPAALLICFFACARTARIAMVLDPGWPDDQKTDVLSAVRPDLQIDDRTYSRHCRQPSTDDPVSGSAGLAPEESDPFYCGFTSGSTGTPKGYLRNHGSWLRSFELSNREFELSDGARIVLAGQLTHSLHLYGAVCGLACGHAVAVVRRFDPRTVLGELSAAGEGGAVLYATPTQLHFLAESVKRTGPVDAVRHVLASGAKWQDRDRERLSRAFPKAELFEFYGASETSFIAVSGPGRNVPAGSVGRPPQEVAVAIGNPAMPLPEGEPGAIWVKSGMLFTGYICGDDPQTHWQDGWLTFGDEGYLNGNGFLFLTGRSNRMIVTSGLNVYPEEIEAVLMSHPGVAAAIVVGLKDPVRGRRLEAAVQLNAEPQGGEDMLLKHCRSRLSAGKLPRRIHLFEALPLTAGGKPDIQRVARELDVRRHAE